MAKDHGLEHVYVHCFLDGRDTPPSSGAQYIATLQRKLDQVGCGEIATVVGRYYAMDRDKRWERVEKAYVCLVDAKGEKATTPKEAVEKANNTPFGLAATLITGDPDRAERVSAQINAGTVWVNCFFVRDLGAPFGGNGKSGIGREGGIYSFDFNCDIKNTVFSPKGWTTKN